MDRLWARFPPEQFARWSSLEKLIDSDPVRVAEFVVELIRPILATQPNPKHKAIAHVEELGKDIVVITHNIGRLHQPAGSSQVIELQGSIFELRYHEAAGTSDFRTFPKKTSPSW